MCASGSRGNSSGDTEKLSATSDVSIVMPVRADGPNNSKVIEVTVESSSHERGMHTCIDKAS